MRGTHLFVEVVVQASAVGRLAMGKGVLAGVVECIPVGKLGLPQLTKLLGSGDQFEFHGKSGVHISLFMVSREKTERSAVWIPTPLREWVSTPPQS